MRVLTAEQMREADRRTIDDVGIPSIVLMENAGRQIVAAMRSTIEDLESRRVGILCGRGNNGGDGFVVARLLSQQGLSVCICLLGAVEDVRGDAGTNLRAVQSLGLSIIEIVDRNAWDRARSGVGECGVLVDAIFGTGLNKPLDDLSNVIVADVNAMHVQIVAVDLPSGLLTDRTDSMGGAIEADVTVTLAAPKLALLLRSAESWVGELVIVDIGIPTSIIDDLPGERLEVLTAEEVGLLIPPRQHDAHKGDFGHVLVVAGSVGKTGAAVLAGLGALRSGAGLVTVATPRGCVPSVSSMVPEYMTLPLPETEDGMVSADALGLILEFGCDAIVVGPGLGTSADVSALVYGLLERSRVPLVLDADALNVFAADPSRLVGRDGVPIVITPHPGEMARLCQSSSAEIQSNRLNTARCFAREHQLFVVLKGSGTVIADPDGAMCLNLTGNAGMSTGGVGDVLAGMIAAWIVQLGRPDYACQVAVFLHGLAGDVASDKHGEVGLIASDLIACLGEAVRKVTQLPETDVT
jgi:NAD(P)H-hydrate epimerase